MQKSTAKQDRNPDERSWDRRAGRQAALKAMAGRPLEAQVLGKGVGRVSHGVLFSILCIVKNRSNKEISTVVSGHEGFVFPNN